MMTAGLLGVGWVVWEEKSGGKRVFAIKRPPVVPSKRRALRKITM
jgi:hypothetical protein